MNMKSITTVELAKELLERAETCDRLLTRLNSLVDEVTAPPAKATGGKSVRTKRSYRSAEEFTAHLKAAGRPLTVVEIARRTGWTKSAVAGYCRRLTQTGQVRMLGSSKPHAFAMAEGDGA